MASFRDSIVETGEKRGMILMIADGRKKKFYCMGLVKMINSWKNWMSIEFVFFTNNALEIGFIFVDVSN